MNVTIQIKAFGKFIIKLYLNNPNNTALNTSCPKIPKRIETQKTANNTPKISAVNTIMFRIFSAIDVFFSFI